jgi:hypothetical protein
MEVTKHAKERQQQRGLSDFALKIIEQNGSWGKAPGGATKVFFGKKDCQRAIGEFKKIIQLFEKARGGTMIIEGNNIITVYKNCF